MIKYEIIRNILYKLFNGEDGLPVETSIRLYVQEANRPGFGENLRSELVELFSDSINWREFLCNTDFEVICSDCENEAWEYAVKILWMPIFDSSPPNPRAES